MDAEPTWAAQYIGVPFLPHGRDPCGWDCYGLVVYILREHYGLEVPSYDAAYLNPMDRDEVGALVRGGLPTSGWREVEDGRPGDAVLFRIAGSPMHVGLLASSSRFMHVDRGHATVLERLASPVWARRLIGTYRYGD